MHYNMRIKTHLNRKILFSLSSSILFFLTYSAFSSETVLYEQCDPQCEAGYICRNNECLPACPPECEGGLECVRGACESPGSDRGVTGPVLRPVTMQPEEKPVNSARPDEDEVSGRESWPRNLGGGVTAGWEYGFGGMFRFGTSRIGGEVGLGYLPVFIMYPEENDSDDDSEYLGRIIHTWNAGARMYVFFMDTWIFQPGIKFGLNWNSAHGAGLDHGFAGMLNISGHVALEFNLGLRIYPWGYRALAERESSMDINLWVQPAVGINILFY